MARKGNGRHRADVELNLLEEFELRSRRSVREAQLAKESRAARRLARKQAKINRAERVKLQHAQAKAGQTAGRFIIRHRTGKSPLRARIENVTVMMVSGGLAATFALPAYAYNPDVAAMAQLATTDARSIAAETGTQGLTVAAVNTVKFARGSYSSAEAWEIARQETLNAYRTYTGLSAEDYLANPKYKNINAAKVLEVAASYVGVPYVFGGSTPAGFDCSGYVAFVFAQFGIALPHSVHGQNRMGQLIRPEDALPGDLVIMSDLSHDGIYAGNGNFYHAPRPGDTVKLAPIFTPKVHFVRLFEQKG